MHMRIHAFVHVCVGAYIHVHMWKLERDIECPVLSLFTYSSEMETVLNLELGWH